MKAAALLLALLPVLVGSLETAAAQTPAAAPATPTAPAAPNEIVRVQPTGGLRAETAALLLSGQEGGGLPIAVLALPLPLPGGGGQSRVPVVVEVDGPALLAGHEEGPLTPLNIEVYLYALGAGGGVEAALLDTVVIPVTGLERLEKSGLKFQAELLLPSGETSLRVLVRNPATRALGLKRIALSVPAFRDEAPTLLPPLFPEPGEAWIAARAAEGATPLPGGVALPAARPVLVPDAEATFQVFAYHFRLEARLAIELRRRGGEKTAEILPVRLDRRASAADLEVLSGSFTLRGVEPGEYELRLVSPGSTGAMGEIRAPTLAVVVSPGAAGRVWASLVPTAAAPTAVAAGAAKETRRLRFSSAPLVAAFRQALSPLAAGDEAGARAAVSAFETAHLVADRSPLPPEELAEIEARVAQELAKRDPEALVPLLMLFEKLYHEALGRHAYLLSTHDGQIVLALAALYVKQSGAAATPAAAGAAARELAADFLVGLARGRLEGGVNSFCRRALERALTYDEGNEAAFLALAVDAGRRGNPRAAAELLEKLLRHHPESLEGRLRMGLTEARLGHAARARSLLGEVVAAKLPGDPADGDPGGAGDPWLRSLAYQELARIERAAGDLDAAARLLDEGLARLPGDDGLRLEKAALLDRRGEHGQAGEILAAIQPQTDGGSTPRHRYNLPPEAAFDRVWSTLEARAAERRSALGALASAATAGTGKNP